MLPRRGTLPFSSPLTTTSARIIYDVSATPTIDSLGCALLELPAELRVLIYHFAVVSDQPLRVLSTRDAAQPALTQTCRQTRKESLPIFYGRNYFRIDTVYQRREPDAHLHPHQIHRFYDLGLVKRVPSPLETWLDKVGCKNIRLLRIITLAHHYKDPGEGKLLPKIASFLAHVGIKKTPPYFSLEVDPKQSADVVTRMVAVLTERLEDLTEFRFVREWAKDDVMEIANMFIDYVGYG